MKIHTIITNQRFKELYKQVSAIFDPKVEQVPLLEIKDNCSEVKVSENNLDF